MIATAEQFREYNMIRDRSVRRRRTFFENRFDGIKKSLSWSASLIRRQKRTASDYLGSMLTRNWKITHRAVIDTVDPGTLSEILGIYHSSFDTISDHLLRRYSAIFGHIFYTAKLENRVVGYCVNYIKLSFSRCGLKKIAVIYSLAVDTRHRRRGIGTQLLDTSIQEMRSNNIDEIRLYVNTNNTPAISLYRPFGFVVVREVPDICGRGERCYEMRLAL